jgi:hypothetical protein
LYQDDLSSRQYWGQAVASSEDSQNKVIKLNTMCRVYEQADRVLTGDPVRVHVVSAPENPAPAWSDGESIYINDKMIENFDLEEIVQINGLNYHELAHHLYTPRKGTTIMQWIVQQEQQSEGYLRAANFLEDQRIETLLTGRYPAIAPYLTKTIVRWLGDTPESTSVNYLCIRGRRYLPLELRIAYRDQFAFPDLIPVIADIVDEYRLLHFSKDYARAQELIHRFKTEVLDVIWPTPPTGTPQSGGNGGDGDESEEQRPMTDGGPHGCGHRVPNKKGTPEPNKAQERDSDRAKGVGQAEPVYNPAKPDGSSSQSSSSGSNTNNDGASTASSKQGNGQGDDGSGDSAVPPSTSSVDLRKPDSRSNTPGSGHSTSDGGLPPNIAEMLRHIDTEINNRSDVRADVKIKQRVITGGDGKHDEVIKPGKYGEVDVPLDVVGQARRFSRELERLKQDLEPTWVREQSSGRVNIQRVIRGCDIDNAFDRWDEGSDGTDIEAVLLVDRSGSMSYDHNDLRASEAAWVIKKSLQQIDAPVTVYSFDDSAELVFERGKKVNNLTMPFIYGNGGTNPRTSLIAAERLLKTSKHSTKIMFIITDGEFHARDNDEIIKRMNNMGVITVLILIANEDYIKNVNERTDQDEAWHHCTVRGSMASAADLIPFAKTVVTTTIRKVSGR